MGIIEKAVSWLEAKAADPTCGYDQTHRWGPDYDCSSFVITAWQNAGVPLKSRGATYTGNLYNVALRLGFKDVTSSVNLKTGVGLQRGDILLNTAHHVATYCGNGREVEASINEKSTARDGQTGDQLGNTYGKGEVLIRSYRNYPWNYILRYMNDTSASDVSTSSVQPSTAPTVLWYGKTTASKLNVRKYPHISAQIVGQLSKGDAVAVEENSHWYKIGKEEYICADYVQKRTNIQAKSGIDVSSYQGKIDWSQVKASGIDFVILRGVEKSGELDSSFEKNYDGALAAGVEIMGAYQYLYALSEAEAVIAANNMVDKLKGRKITIWLDLEWNDLRATNRVTEIANAYLDACMAQGYSVGVYSNLDWYQNVYKPSEIHATRFWIARYATSGEYKESLRPNVGEEIWQWGSKGTVNGINGAVDMDIMDDNSGTHIVTASTLNIRSLPCTIDPDCEIVGKLKKGDTVQVLDESLWYKVQNDKVVGWASSAYISK